MPQPCGYRRQGTPLARRCERCLSEYRLAPFGSFSPRNSSGSARDTVAPQGREPARRDGFRSHYLQTSVLLFTGEVATGASVSRKLMPLAGQAGINGSRRGPTVLAKVTKWAFLLGQDHILT